MNPPVPNTKQLLDANVLSFIAYIRELFGIEFNPNTGKGSVAAEVSKEKIKALYEAVPIFFPHTAQFLSLCQDYSAQPFSGIYYKTEWAGIDKALLKNLATAAIVGGTTVLTGQIGFNVAAGGIAAFGINALHSAFSKRQDLKRLPLGVFLNLEKKSKR